MELDYDLSACLRHNPQDGITEDTISAVLAVWEGQNDGDEWRWVVALTDGRFAFIQGGCDYTGWECRSWAYSRIAPSAEVAAQTAGQDTIGFAGNRLMVKESLLRQIAAGKAETWREAKDREFGVTSGR